MIHDADVEATSLVWHENPDAEMRGWYVVTHNSDGEPVEVTGPVAHDARAVIVALVDIFPEPLDGDKTRSAPLLTAMAIRRLSESIGKQSTEGDDKPSTALQRTLELRNELELRKADPEGAPTTAD